MSGCRGAKTNRTVNDKETVEITDMAGRKVNVPVHVKSVFGADMTVTYFLESLAPEMILGRNVIPTKAEISVMPEKILNLPVLGMIFYGKSTVNSEELAKLKPDILLCPLFKHTTPSYIADFESYGRKTGAVVVMVDLDINRLPEAFRFVGKLLGKEEYAGTLADYCRETLDLADSVRKAVHDTVSIYISEGKVGLHTIPAHSTHSQVFDVAGVKNCAEIDEDFGYKDMSISMEQILMWNPDYILVSSRMAPDEQKDIINNMKKDRAWQTLKAVRNNNVVFVPSAPHNWLGRPPGINRLLGVRWLQSILYPNIIKQDMVKETIRFFSLFYHVNISRDKAKELINNNFRKG